MDAKPARNVSSRNCSEATLPCICTVSTIVEKELDQHSEKKLTSIRSLSPSSHPSPDIKFFHQQQARSYPLAQILHWTLKILALLSAVIFGLWAPLSYMLQKDGNESSDVAQEQLLRVMEGLAARVESVEERLAGMGRLRVLEFCRSAAGKKLEACEDISASANVADIIGGLATKQAKHQPSERRTVVWSAPSSSISTSASITHSELTVSATATATHKPILSLSTFDPSTMSTRTTGWLTLKPWPRPTNRVIPRPEGEVGQVIMEETPISTTITTQVAAISTFDPSKLYTSHPGGWITLTPIPRPTRAAVLYEGHKSDGFEQPLRGDVGNGTHCRVTKANLGLAIAILALMLLGWVRWSRRCEMRGRRRRVVYEKSGVGLDGRV